MRGHGRLRVTHGDTRTAHALAWLLRLPRASAAADTELVVTPCAGGHEWRRTFGDQPLNSRQYPVGNGEVAERFGPLELTFHRECANGTTTYRQVRAALVGGPLRIPLPPACAPSVRAREDRTGPRTLHIDVRVDAPLVGTVLTYAGTIEIDEAGAS